MKSVGHMLKEARETCGYTLQDVEKKTKICEEYLCAMEENAFDQLPESPFVRGFLRTYALELGLNPESVVAIYRRDFGNAKKQSVIPKGVMNPIQRKTRVMISPVVFAVGVMVVVASLYITYQWMMLTQPPPLVLDAPKDNQGVQSPFEVRGKTSTDAVIIVNDVPTAVDQNGAFISLVSLETGEHTLVIEARSRQNKVRSVRKTVRVVE